MEQMEQIEKMEEVKMKSEDGNDDINEATLCPEIKLEIPDQVFDNWLPTKRFSLSRRSKPLFTCGHCDESTVKPPKLVKHILSKHRGELFNCSLCGNKFDIGDEFIKHAQIVHKAYEYKEEFDNKQAPCNICEKIFSSNKNLAAHKRSAHTNEPQICELCSVQFKNKDNLRNHMKIVHSEAQVICPDCGKQFKAKSYLWVHRQAVHETSDNMICHICARKCKNDYSLKKHLRNCTLRPRQPPTSYVMGKTDKYPEEFFCQECDKHFVSQSMFRFHESYSHSTGEMTCILCQKMMKNMMLLRQHYRRQHAMEKFQVKVLTGGGGPDNSEAALGHKGFIIGRSDEYPIEQYCTECDKTFVSHKTFVAHTRYSHTLMSITCNMCKKKFKNQEILKQHLRKIHGMTDKHEIRQIVEESKGIISPENDSPEEDSAKKDSQEDIQNDEKESKEESNPTPQNGAHSLPTSMAREHQKQTFSGYDNMNHMNQFPHQTNFNVINHLIEACNDLTSRNQMGHYKFGPNDMNRSHQPHHFRNENAAMMYNNWANRSYDQFRPEYVKDEQKYMRDLPVEVKVQVKDEVDEPSVENGAVNDEESDNNEGYVEEYNSSSHRMSMCGKCSKPVSNLANHMSLFHPQDDEEFLCPWCPKMFENQSNLRNHLHNYHNPNPPQSNAASVYDAYHSQTRT